MEFTLVNIYSYNDLIYSNEDEHKIPWLFLFEKKNFCVRRISSFSLLSEISKTFFFFLLFYFCCLSEWWWCCLRVQHFDQLIIRQYISKLSTQKALAFQKSFFNTHCLHIFTHTSAQCSNVFFSAFFFIYTFFVFYSLFFSLSRAAKFYGSFEIWKNCIVRMHTDFTVKRTKQQKKMQFFFSPEEQEKNSFLNKR